MLRNGIDSAAAGMRRKDGLMKGQMEECGILWSPRWESIMVGYSMLVTAVVKQPHSSYSCSSNSLRIDTEPQSVQVWIRRWNSIVIGMAGDQLLAMHPATKDPR